MNIFLLSVCVIILAGGGSNTDQHHVVSLSDSNIPQYMSRFERNKPIMALVGENSFCELTDFGIPDGFSKQSQVAEVFALGASSGEINMFPALELRSDFSTAEFDTEYLQGAD